MKWVHSDTKLASKSNLDFGKLGGTVDTTFTPKYTSAGVDSALYDVSKTWYTTFTIMLPDGLEWKPSATTDNTKVTWVWHAPLCAGSNKLTPGAALTVKYGTNNAA